MDSAQQTIEVPTEVVKDCWIALMATMQHPLNTCNQGQAPFCFICTAISALQPYHHREAHSWFGIKKG